jgi:hypothetical protein
VFNYETGKHRVENVTKSGFDRCNIGTIPLLLFTNSTERVILDQTGQQYFICTIAGHCSAGQKLSINVVNASTSPVSAPQPTELIPPHFGMYSHKLRLISSWSIKKKKLCFDILKIYLFVILIHFVNFL